MDKEHKNRSGSQSNDGSKDGRGDVKQKVQPGAPSRGNNQGQRHEKDDSNGGPEKNTTKKQQNAI